MGQGMHIRRLFRHIPKRLWRAIAPGANSSRAATVATGSCSDRSYGLTGANGLGKSRVQIGIPQVVAAQPLAVHLRHVTRGYYFGLRILDANDSGSRHYGNHPWARNPKKRLRAVIYENRDTWGDG